MGDNSYLSYKYNKAVVLLPVWQSRFFSRSRLQNFADPDSEMGPICVDYFFGLLFDAIYF
jgi:hypothetical protein